MSWHKEIYIVRDFGGEYEDSWEYPVCAFTSKGAAQSCAIKRERRHDARRMPDDYCGSDVKSVRLVIDGKPGAWDGIGRNALRKLVEIGERAIKREPLGLSGMTYVPLDELEKMGEQT